MMHIIAIVGNAGCGKDTIARWLYEHEWWDVLVSYTTRPMRDNETNGVEHIFVSHPKDIVGDIGKDSIKNVLAYTKYGGYEYWTTIDQVSDKRPTIYIVDECGLKDMLDKKDEYGFVLTSIRVSADEEARLKRGVSMERIERDKTRVNPLPHFEYDYEVKNNKSMKALEHQLNAIVMDIKFARSV